MNRRTEYASGPDYQYWLDRLHQLNDAPTDSAHVGVETASSEAKTESQHAIEVRNEAVGSAALTQAVEWRAAILRQRIPRSGPIWPVVVRPEAPMLRDAPDHCSMCGDRKDESMRYCCTPCLRAKEIVLREVREGN